MADIERNENEILRVEKKEFKGHEYIDLRIYFMGDDGDYKPTKKGVTVKPDKLDELIKHLTDLKG